MIPDQLVSISYVRERIERVIDRGASNPDPAAQTAAHQTQKTSPSVDQTMDLHHLNDPALRLTTAAHQLANEPDDGWFDWLEDQGLAMSAPPQHRRSLSARRGSSADFTPAPGSPLARTFPGGASAWTYGFSRDLSIAGRSGYHFAKTTAGSRTARARRRKTGCSG